MHAVHWLRTRQEEREFAYWLSLVAYEHRDHSLANRIYLLYLIIFFGIWIFATLTFFASGGAVFLRLLNPIDPVRAAIFLEVLLMGVWSVFAFWQSLRRSPVVFSEQDAVLICQMPVNRRHVTLRWFPMPWLKSAVLFWLAAIALGFSVAEVTLPGVMDASHIPEYATYGFRALAATLPIHLALFSLQWVMGIVRLQKNLERHWLAWLVIPLTIVFFSFLLIFTLDLNIPFRAPWNDIAKALLIPLQAGFGYGNLSVSLLYSGFIAAAMLGIMAWVSGSFSLSRAAQETGEIEVIHSAQQYGLTSYAKQLQTQQQLGVKRAPSRLLAFTGVRILVWKDLLQSQRSFRLSALFVWFRIFFLMISLPLLPDLGSRALVIAIWVIQIGQVSVVRIRSDLSQWSLVRQLPFSHKKFLLFELGSAYLLSVMASLAGLAICSLIMKTPIDGWAALVPGIVAGVAGMAAFDIIRRSRSNLLLAGSVPEISAGGILFGVIFAAAPFLLNALLSGMIGLILSILLSLGLGSLAFNLAVRSYRTMDASR